ncbi:hypothetical protein DSO57_1025320 [Entomophthora muscae]|uniref:Uncharacterized protein n=1 Tax=Entomophthora muscae TaxID=34485 RepID=A0ACC2RTH9_9FUNG|nr:hypothetical protein DSO57_1025320 [Entomophthora muscae]
MYNEIPALRCMLSKWEKELEAAQDVLAVLRPFGKDTTRVEVSIQKVKIKAILDTGSPVNVVSSKLMKKLKLAPDLNYTQNMVLLAWLRLELLVLTMPVVTHMGAVLQARVDLASNKVNVMKSDNMWLI